MDLSQQTQLCVKQCTVFFPAFVSFAGKGDTGKLDPKTQLQLQQIAKGAAKENKISLIVTSDIYLEHRTSCSSLENNK